jgi:hypothetical protein
MPALDPGIHEKRVVEVDGLAGQVQQITAANRLLLARLESKKSLLFAEKPYAASN